jgi:protein-tyrosine phosphatase
LTFTATGKNRSVVTFAAWLALEGLVPTIDAGVAWVRSCRPIVHPQVCVVMAVHQCAVIAFVSVWMLVVCLAVHAPSGAVR